jgi:hypothetical protein
MSTTVIVAIITIGLFILVATAIILQTMDKNAKEKRRIESALLARSRNFEYMLEGFPKGFLNRNLQILVCNCLDEVFSQLVQINPKSAAYKTKLAKAQQRLQEFKAKPASDTSVTLTDTAQIKEIQKMLSSLYNFIAKLAASKRINAKEAKIYGKQVRRLMVQTSTDVLAEPIRNALTKSNPRLAIHYLHMANQKMKQENDDGFYTEQIKQQSTRITELEEEADRLDNQTKEGRAEADAEWAKLDKPNESWKKNAVYD